MHFEIIKKIATKTNIVKMKWRIWLQPNLSTGIDNDYAASVNLAGKKVIRSRDIAKFIKDSGSEVELETLEQILEQHDRIVCEKLQQGHGVLTGFCQLTPTVTGSFGARGKFIPDVHKITLDIVLSAEMRAMLKEVDIVIMGVKDGGTFIGLVTDTSTGLTDGTITAGDDILIEGDKIQIDPLGENGLGVFFVNADGDAIPVTRRLTQNEPQRLIARVPNDLPPGQYTLRVVTKYTTSSILLMEPRVIEYDKLLIVP